MPMFLCSVIYLKQQIRFKISNPVPNEKKYGTVKGISITNLDQTSEKGGKGDKK